MAVLIQTISIAYLTGITAWTCGALFHDVGQCSKWGWGLIASCLALVFASIYFLELRWALALVTALFVLFLAWWFSQRPSNDRSWAPNLSKLCRIEIEGDDVVVHNVRNSRYRSLTDYDALYETRRYRLSQLHAADVLILFWGSNWMSHPMVIFDFGQNQHLCFSIEVRYRQGQTYSLLRGLFRQYELMYVVSDERDAILLRTEHAENQDCYLYRLQMEPKDVRQLFQEYVDATNQLRETPRWYHAIADNCTTAIVRQRTEKVDLDSRLYFNGSLDRLLYERGRLDNSLPFNELKKRCRINESANLATGDFHEAIRKGLPGFDGRQLSPKNNLP